MKIQIAILFLIIFGAFGCKKDVEITEIPDDRTCPINYEIKKSQTYLLEQTWRFVGFQNAGSKQIDYPPCEGYDYINKYYKNAYELTLSFTDSVKPPFNYTTKKFSYYFNGNTTINEFYGTCELDTSKNLTFSPAWTTLVYGPERMINYETKYISTLKYVYKYEIQTNVLTLFYTAKEDKMIFVAK